jgi:histone acetyltransferase (RNA polymerase elongator complex component)
LRAYADYTEAVKIMVVSPLPAKTKHLIYPLFLPNQGCPGSCIYCDQVKISGAGAFDLDKAVREVAEFIQRNPKRSKEVAFYGGTFTALSLSFREEILSRILEVVDEGTRLRISTHPLWINEDILRHCAEYRIQTIELGIQDWHDRPLALSGRGYTLPSARSGSSGERYGLHSWHPTHARLPVAT